MGRAAATSASASASEDGRAFADRSNTCEVQLPKDWKINPGVMASAESPSGDERVELEPVLAKVHVDYQKRREQLTHNWNRNAGFTVLQSDPSRTLMRFSNGTRVQWVALSATPVVCEATLSARHTDDEVIARIAASLHAVHQ
jgi:hypothetical protein